MPLPHDVAMPVPDVSLRCPPDVCVGAVLGDALHRVVVLGGREGMPRSLGSVYGAAVTRFLGGSFRGHATRVIALPGVESWSGGVAVSRDGSTLLVSDSFGASPTIHEFGVADGSRRVSLAVSMGRCSSTGRSSCASRPTASCSSRSTATTACRC